MSTALLNLLFAQTIYKYAAEGEESEFSKEKKTDGSQSPPVQFVRLAEELKNHPLNSNFHLSPQACQSLYNALLPNTPNRPTVDMLEPLLEKLFESYKRDVTQQIRRREQEYKSRIKEIEEIQQGKWDAELVKEYEQEMKNASNPDAPVSQQQQLQQLRLQKQLELQQKQEQERKIHIQKQAIQKQKQLEKQQALIKQERERQTKSDHDKQTQSSDNDTSSRESSTVENERQESVSTENVAEKRKLRNRGSESPKKSESPETDEIMEEPEEDEKEEEPENDDEKPEAEVEEDEDEGEAVEEDEEDEEEAEEDEDEDDESADETDGDQSVNEENQLKRKRQSLSTTNRRFQQLTTPLLTDISSNKSASFFLHPVNPNDAPNYYNLIKQPMDLRTIKSMVKSGEIPTSAELERDLQHMFANSIMYNDWNSDVAQYAREMQRDTDTLLTLFRHAEGGASTPGPDEDRKRRKK